MKSEDEPTIVDAYFERVAGALYDELIRKAVPGYEALHDMVAALLGAELGPEARVLVAGSGTGTEIVRMAGLQPAWMFTGVDPNRRMIVAAESNIQEAALSDRVRLICGAVADLPPALQFDAAVCILVLNFVPDDGSKEKLLQSVSDHLLPGAPFVLVDMPWREEQKGFGPFFEAWKEYQLREGVPADHFSESHFQGVRDLFHLVSEERILDGLKNAGFSEPEPFYGAFMFKGWISRRRERP